MHTDDNFSLLLAEIEASVASAPGDETYCHLLVFFYIPDGGDQTPPPNARPRVFYLVARLNSQGSSIWVRENENKHLRYSPLCNIGVHFLHCPTFLGFLGRLHAFQMTLRPMLPCIPLITACLSLRRLQRTLT